MFIENDAIKKKFRDRGNDKNALSTDYEELDFKAKAEDEVIKVAKCTYANDFKGQSTFYFCQCSVEEFYPICEACAEKCHKHHNPTLKLQGIYTCMCGKGNHHIHKENERRYNEKKLKTMNQCFFSKFMDITPHRGYFKYEGKIICSVCVQYCCNKSFSDPEIHLSDEIQPYCNCEKHYEVNVINLNLELLSKPKFHLNLQNFNYNILAKITTTKHMYIDYLITKISEYQAAPSHKNSKNFFSNFINFKILELFSAFASRWENKFFHVKNYFQPFSNEILFKMMSLDEPVSILTENEAPDFATAKFYFAEFIFNYIIRTYQLKYNNLWNIRTIVNMNLFQRFIYLKELKNYFKFDYYNNGNMNSSDSKFEEMSVTFVELYDNILKINENFEFSSQIFSYIFPTFNRIFKYLIKYNHISNELKAKYFELVLDTLSLGSENDDRKKIFYN
jgi:hypothetical protein